MNTPMIQTSLTAIALFASVAILDASAATLSFQVTGFGPTPVPQFDPALGTLHSVTGSVSAMASVPGHIVNFGPPVEFGLIEVFSTGGAFIAQHPALEIVAALAGLPQVHGLLGQESLEVVGESSGFQQEIASSTAAFIGTGDVTFDLFGEPGDFMAVPLTPTTTGSPTGAGVVDGVLTITYDYTPIPEPSSLLLAALAGLSPLRRRRNKSPR